MTTDKTTPPAAFFKPFGEIELTLIEADFLSVLRQEPLLAPFDDPEISAAALVDGVTVGERAAERLAWARAMRLLLKRIDDARPGIEEQLAAIENARSSRPRRIRTARLPKRARTGR